MNQLSEKNPKTLLLSALLSLFIILCSCSTFCPDPISPIKSSETIEPDYFLAIYVDAKHFDYSTAENCLNSLLKNRRNGYFGHAWIYLKGIQNGYPFVIKGGHSGETGCLQLRYFDGVAKLMDLDDPNPIRYLFEELQDGFFQEGSGQHVPTFAAMRCLTAEQFEQICAYVEMYPFHTYKLTQNQCTSFVIQVAALASWSLQGAVTLQIPSTLKFCGSKVALWENSKYSSITFFTPDRLEESLKNSVEQGEAIAIF